jgi:hypothetical protein
MRTSEPIHSSSKWTFSYPFLYVTNAIFLFIKGDLGMLQHRMKAQVPLVLLSSAIEHAAIFILMIS